MRRILALVAVMAAVLLGAPTTGAANPSFDYGFSSSGGLTVQLGIRFAQGRFYVARDSNMVVVSSGTVQTNDYVVPLTMTAPGGLHVTIDGQTTFVDTDRDAWWL